MLNVLFCGYRDWALSIIDEIKKHPKIKCIDIITSKEDYNTKVSTFNDNIDFILFLGWSWIIPKEVTEKYLCIGIHPSDLPLFRGGSPLQHQIIDGVINSKVTLMTLSNKKLDAGEIWMKEELNLNGDNMASVFENIINSSIKLLNNFIDEFPLIKPITQKVEEGSYYKRRRPEQSKIKMEDFQNKSIEELYNFIRALTDPYPNAYIEDEYGNKLLFKEVKYIPYSDL
jgi:methionyl-tRNA formyltransferase